MTRPRGDDGAYAILYALLLLVVLGVAALVVDGASLREDRRQSRLASDAAAVAGARALSPLAAPNPRQACEDAWDYVLLNMGALPAPSSTGCGSFPTTVADPCPTTAHVGTGTTEGVTVTVTWPVTDGSPLMEPNARPADAATTTQPIDPLVDGTDPCERIAVSVEQVHEALFAALWGVGANTTSGTSVARAAVVPGDPQAVAALNVLNETTCNAVRTDGQGFIEIGAVGGRPGIVAIESDGTHAGSGCPNNEPYVLNPALNNSGAYVRADGAVAGDGKGIIQMYALNPSSDGDAADAFNASIVPPAGTLLQPRPTPLAQRSGSAPVTNIYDCKADRDCKRTPTKYLTNLVAAYDRTSPVPYSGSPAPYDSGLTAPFQTFNNCEIKPQDKVLVLAGNWYVDCATLDVKGVLVFAGGNVVTRGGVDVSGCLALNVALTGTATCPSVTNGEVSSPVGAESVLFLRSGNLTKGAQGQVFLPRTFTYLKSGSIGLGGGSGTLYWTNPAPTGGCTGACADARFGKLALWAESSAEMQLGGQSALTLRGVVFTPNARFAYSGQPTQHQTKAQVWADTLLVTGKSGLQLAPDPNDAVATDALNVALIR